MSKYNPLCNYLKNCDLKVVILEFEEIEEILGFVLPTSAYKYEWWWANEDVNTTNHSHCKSWQGAGYKVDRVDFSNRIVSFFKE